MPKVDDQLFWTNIFLINYYHERYKNDKEFRRFSFELQLLLIFWKIFLVFSLYFLVRKYSYRVFGTNRSAKAAFVKYFQLSVICKGTRAITLEEGRTVALIRPSGSTKYYYFCLSKSPLNLSLPYLQPPLAPIILIANNDRCQPKRRPLPIKSTDKIELSRHSLRLCTPSFAVDTHRS